MGDLQKYVQGTITEILQAMDSLSNAPELQHMEVTAFPFVAFSDDLTSVGIFKAKVLNQDGETEHRPVICFQFDVGLSFEEQTQGEVGVEGGFKLKIWGAGEAGAKTKGSEKGSTSALEANRVKFTVPVQIKPSDNLTKAHKEGEQRVQDARAERQKQKGSNLAGGRNSWMG